MANIVGKPTEGIIMRKPHLENRLLDFLRRELELNTDRELAQLLKLGFPTISKIRHGNTVSDLIILRIHECTDIPVRVIREQIE